MGTRWRGLLAPINKPTGDGRRMAEGAMRHRELPLALKWQREDDMGHDASVIVGLIEGVLIGTTQEAIDGGWISAERAAAVGMETDDLGMWAHGELFDDHPELSRLTEDVKEAILLVQKGVIGPSVDGGEVEFVFVREGSDTPLTDAEWDALLEEELETGEPAPIEMLFTDFEVAAGTLVSIPAFRETTQPFEVLADAPSSCPPGTHRMPDGSCMANENMQGLTAAVIGQIDLPVAERDHPWDGDEARRRVFEACTDGDDVDVECVSRAFLWRDDEADPETMGAYKLGFADWIDGQLRIVPQGVASTAGGRGVNAADIPEDAKERIRGRICSLYDRIREVHEDWPECPFEREEEGSQKRAAILAAAGAELSRYPAEWFEDPKLSEVTPITVTDDGRVFGHAAQWGVCHVGIPGVCTTAPHSESGYSYFHRYLVDTTAGSVEVGRLTTGYGRIGTGCKCCRGKDDHACDKATLSQAIDHYDRLKTLAWVRAGEDEHGIWIAGALATPPDQLTDHDKRILGRRMVSGDWRLVAGRLEMVEVLALAKERPGFPLRLSNGRQLSLTAAGFVNPERRRSKPEPTTPQLNIDYKRLGNQVAVTLLRQQGVLGRIPNLQKANLTVAEAHTGAMIALRMTDDDAARLAIEGGEPPEQLHLTLMYLGQADELSAEMRENIVSSVQQAAAEWQAFDAEAFAVDVFNPESDERETAIVLGISGQPVEAIHADIRSRVPANLEAMLGEEARDALPEQHAPFVAHVTLAYSDDLSLVEQLTDRTGKPVRFDRLRVAFAGEITDFPLAAPADTDVEAEAARLTAELAATLEEIDVADRAREAAELIAQLEV